MVTSANVGELLVPTACPIAKLILLPLREAVVPVPLLNEIVSPFVIAVDPAVLALILKLALALLPSLPDEPYEPL